MKVSPRLPVAVLTAGVVYTLMLFISGAVLPLSDGINKAMAAVMKPDTTVLIIVNAMSAGCLIGWVICDSRFRGILSYPGAILVLWLVMSILNQMEVLYFRAALPLFTDKDLVNMTLQEIMKLIPTVAAAMLISRKARAVRLGIALPLLPKGFIGRIAVATVVYPFIYYGFGFIAWAFPATRELYAGWADESRGVVPLLSFQLIRGALWGICAMYIARGAGNRSRALVQVPALFVAATAWGLILPNPVMPPEVRLAHGIELTLSMILIGYLAALLFRPEKGLKTAPGNSGT